MELEFDKEIDSLLRQESRGKTITISEFAGVHLDADEIAAFVENAVPERTRNSFVQHFAGCDPCRKTLSKAMTLRSDENLEPAKSIVAPVEKSVPWYRRFFLFPNLAYVVGGLVLLFAGFIGLSVLNRSTSNGSFEMSKTSSDEAPFATPQYAMNSNASSASANTAANATNTMSAANVAPGISDQTLEVTENDPAKGKGPGVPADLDDTAPRLSQPSVAAPPPPAAAAPSKDSGFLTDGVDAKRARELRAEPKQPAKAEEQKLMGGVSQSTQSSQNVQLNQAPGNAKGPFVQRNDSRNVERAIEQNKARDREADLASKSVEKKKSDKGTGSAVPIKPASDRKQVSGKTFEFRSGAWYDTTYNGQGTTNVRRNSDNYKKLDRGLRGIAESFIGTVVTIWNGKAYRID